VDLPPPHRGRSEIAPDGARVELLALSGTAQMAKFILPGGAVARAVRHRSVNEFWYVAAGSGQLWRRWGKDEILENLVPGIAGVIPGRAAFQWRADPGPDLEIVGVTMPPWPGDDEAQPAEGPWQPTV
jgi:mannose-6-phosphate isomerase-like protein (cupin superfamily)